MGKANIHLFHHLTNSCQVFNLCQVVLGMVIQQSELLFSQGERDNQEINMQVNKMSKISITLDK